MESSENLDVKKNLILGQQQNSINILLVEDDYVSQLIISKMCNNEKWDIYIVSNGKEALQILESRKFNIILMDIQMQEMSGIEVAKIIREKERLTGEHIPIIATSTFATSQDKINAINSGMDDYINKPIDLKKVKEIVLTYAK